MQINSTVSFTGKKPPKKPKTQNKGYFLSSSSETLVAAPLAAAGLGVSIGARKLTQLNAQDTIEIKKGIQEGLKDSGLYDKGVRVYRFQEVGPKTLVKRAIAEVQKLRNSEEAIGPENIKEALNNFFGYGKKDRKALNVMRNAIDEGFDEMQSYTARTQAGASEETQNAISQIKNIVSDFGSKAMGLRYKLGLSADYLPGMNTIFAPDKSLQTNVFHEMGHALSVDSSFVKALQKVRPVAYLLPGFILTAALLNKRKANDEQLPTDSKIQRLKDGVKRNAGKLTALAFAPMLLEEGIASLKGGQVAKNLFKDGKLSKELLNKVRLTNAANFASYALVALGIALGTRVAVKVKDKLQAKYEAKQDAKYQVKLEKYKQKMAAAEASKAAKAEKKLAKTTTQA